MKNIKRIQACSTDHSFFLFGPRGTGKTTLVKELFQNAYLLDLLNPKLEQELSLHPERLQQYVDGACAAGRLHFVVDEVQKIPKLLDMVHLIIEQKRPICFVLTGSSARKLKRGGANLLAGRAFTYHLDPFSVLELPAHSIPTLSSLLSWGMLPKIFELDSDANKALYLDSYAQIYLREEISAEQLVRNVQPFRRFLEVAAHNSGKIINASKIALDCGVSDKTVVEYYRILEDTLLGVFVEPFHNSFRKRMGAKPKFYFFDVGVTRALTGALEMIPAEGTSYFGDLFEQFLFTEILKLIRIYKRSTKISFYRAKEQKEVDLVIEEFGKPPIFIEIKSAAAVTSEKLSVFNDIFEIFADSRCLCLCREELHRVVTLAKGVVEIWPWEKALREFFGKAS